MFGAVRWGVFVRGSTGMGYGKGWTLLFGDVRADGFVVEGCRRRGTVRGGMKLRRTVGRRNFRGGAFERWWWCYGVVLSWELAGRVCGGMG